MDLDSSQINNKQSKESSKINLLPEHLIDQIKAGEVIERPASLIKEIIENSIDAGSTQIDLHLVNCGIDLISIIDNGHGMLFEDLPYAFCRHATSKIERFEDLYKLSSFGFRGEALASISSIARVTCTSIPNSNPEEGGKIIIHGGETKAHAKQPGSTPGTSIFIKDLFYNTPARLKFIKSQISEKNALQRVIQSFIISNPQISFSIKWDDNDKDFYPTTGGDFKKRIGQVFNKNKKEQELFEYSANYEGHTVTAYLSKSSTKGNSYKKQFLFANHRLFTDKQIHQTILRNCEGLYPQGEMGHYCIFIDVPPNLIDVNVHPNKTQIKFFKLPVITALLSSELKKLKEVHKIPENHLFEQQDYNLRENSSSTTQGFQNYSQSLSQSDYSSPRPLRSAPITSSQQQSSITFDNILSPIQQYQNGDSNYLIHKYYFMSDFLASIINSDDINDFIPLLISSPIMITPVESEERVLQQLLEMGLQLERLDEQSLVLRSYHKSFQDFPIEEFISHFVENDCSLDFLKSTTFEFNQKWIATNLLKLKGVKELTSDLIESIFHE